MYEGRNAGMQKCRKKGNPRRAMPFLMKNKKFDNAP
jgi:hypothetical protein